MTARSPTLFGGRIETNDLAWLAGLDTAQNAYSTSEPHGFIFGRIMG